MRLKVTFLTDEYGDDPDRLLDTVAGIGGFDVEIEEVEDDPAPRVRRPKPRAR